MVQNGEVSSSVSSTAKTFCLDDAYARCTTFPKFLTTDCFLAIWNLKLGFEFARGYK